ncbi:TetR family transcriptional regulator [Nocardioides sp. Root1257]|uniref:TetR/AcrR family transcriptional regulator n=1 Tax=unclassified Nocardioides TaxID=2615069 RepID=UPI0006F93A58|nr:MULTISPECIES: TetR/AcrR family transcriptional regulator [unclassified Nocardioides]KQW47289.1 TetR family transcriptional regulator [Nocardioides sp. Root1257]KRC45445.1 TetR family transcriptional regulator [Nocardioides sp. Root224]
MPRADARRNVAAILAAAQACLVRDPEATLSAIAEEAGVGRVTLHGHFATRAILVDQVFRQVHAEAEEILGATDTTGDPVAAVTRLLSASWEVVHRFRSVMTAAQRELPEELVREHHDKHLARMAALVRRGRREGVFRTDLPEGWLVTVAYTVMHAAATECVAGRLDAAGAEQAVVSTVLAAYTPPGAEVLTPNR